MKDDHAFEKALGSGQRGEGVACCANGQGRLERICLDTGKGICPGCGMRSRRRHGWHHRRLQDYPAHGETVTVQLRIGRWRCTFHDCSRSTFSNEVSVAAPHDRRTARTAEIASHLGRATGGRPAERLTRRLGMIGWK
ncbi:transposase family protein [Mesorhizobium sp. M0659]|uniref:transposase family protein n=1 Tax=Mesorhizobium sp. M0659 TaxID=2956980 RepID=UPI00333CAFDE